MIAAIVPKTIASIFGLSSPSNEPVQAKNKMRLEAIK